MIEPFPESALNEEAARMLLEEYDEYFARAKMFTKVHAAKVEEGSGAAMATATTAKKKGNVLDAKDGNSLSESGKENGSASRKGKRHPPVAKTQTSSRKQRRWIRRRV